MSATSFPTMMELKQCWAIWAMGIMDSILTWKLHKVKRKRKKVWRKQVIHIKNLGICSCNKKLKKDSKYNKVHKNNIWKTVDKLKILKKTKWVKRAKEISWNIDLRGNWAQGHYCKSEKNKMKNIIEKCSRN